MLGGTRPRGQYPAASRTPKTGEVMVRAIIEVEPDRVWDRAHVLKDKELVRKAMETSKLKLAALCAEIEMEISTIESLGDASFSRTAMELIHRWLIEGAQPETPFAVLVTMKE